MDAIHTHDSRCSLVVDLEMKCHSSMAIGRMDEVDLMYLSCEQFIMRWLERYIVAAGAWNTQDLCGVYLGG